MIDAGAKFLSTTSFLPDVWSVCQKCNIPLTCGVQSVADCQQALEEKVNFFKIYPINTISDPTIQDMIHSIRTGNPNAKIFASGGIQLDQLPTLAKLGFDNIIIGYDSKQMQLKDIGEDFQRFCNHWQKCKTSTSPHRNLHS